MFLKEASTTMHTHITRGLAVIIFLTGLSAAAFAQSAQPEERFSAEFGLGWDNGISGNINSSGIGTPEQSDGRDTEEQI